MSSPNFMTPSDPSDSATVPNEGMHRLYTKYVIPNLLEAGAVEAYLSVLDGLRADFAEAPVPEDHPKLRELEALRVEIRHVRAQAFLMGELDLNEVARQEVVDHASGVEMDRHWAAVRAERAARGAEYRRWRAAAKRRMRPALLCHRCGRETRSHVTVKLGIGSTVVMSAHCAARWEAERARDQGRVSEYMPMFDFSSGTENRDEA